MRGYVFFVTNDYYKINNIGLLAFPGGESVPVTACCLYVR
jgi:hypothetical protein